MGQYNQHCVLCKLCVFVKLYLRVFYFCVDNANLLVKKKMRPVTHPPIIFFNNFLPNQDLREVLFLIRKNHCYCVVIFVFVCYKNLEPTM